MREVLDVLAVVLVLAPAPAAARGPGGSGRPTAATPLPRAGERRTGRCVRHHGRRRPHDHRCHDPQHPGRRRRRRRWSDPCRPHPRHHGRPFRRCRARPHHRCCRPPRHRVGRTRRRPRSDREPRPRPAPPPRPKRAAAPPPATMPPMPIAVPAPPMPPEGTPPGVVVPVEGVGTPLPGVRPPVSVGASTETSGNPPQISSSGSPVGGTQTVGSLGRRRRRRRRRWARRPRWASAACSPPGTTCPPATAATTTTAQGPTVWVPPTGDPDDEICGGFPEVSVDAPTETGGLTPGSGVPDALHRDDDPRRCPLGRHRGCRHGDGHGWHGRRRRCRRPLRARRWRGPRPGARGSLPGASARPADPVSWGSAAPVVRPRAATAERPAVVARVRAARVAPPSSPGGGQGAAGRGTGGRGGAGGRGAGRTGRYGVPQLGERGGRGRATGAAGTAGSRGGRREDEHDGQDVEHLTHEDEETWFEGSDNADPPVSGVSPSTRPGAAAPGRSCVGVWWTGRQAAQRLDAAGRDNAERQHEDDGQRLDPGRRARSTAIRGSSCRPTTGAAEQTDIDALAGLYRGGRRHEGGGRGRELRARTRRPGQRRVRSRVKRD